MTEHHHLVDSRKKFIFLMLILGAIIAIGPIAIDMYLPAFLAISNDFSASEENIQLSLTSYFAGMAISQLFYGPVIDRFGRKAPLFFGLFVFTISSFLCCFAQNIEHLIILRFFQALGACAAIVIPRTIIRDIFSPQESARAFSHLMLVMGIAPILAPMLGSFVLYKFGWKAIFAFLAIYAICCAILSYFHLPITKTANPDDKISHALKKYIGIFKDRNFVVCAVTGGLAMSALFTYITGSPFIYLDFFHISAKKYSLVFAINSIGFITASQINARLLKKYSISEVLEKAIFIPAITGILLIFTGAFYPNFYLTTALYFMFLASIGVINPNTTAYALANQATHAGSASALLGTIQFVFAIITSFLVSKLHDGTTMPLAFIVGLCGILTLVVFKIWHQRE